MDEFTHLPNFSSPSKLELPLVTIGYYPIRGKAQVPRLICEYLRIPYEDKLYGLTEWEKDKKSITKEHDFFDLPYLKDGDFIVSEAFPISQYVIQKYGEKQLLGKNLKDKGIVQMYLWTISSMNNIININCSRNKTDEELKIFKQKQWRSCVYPELKKYEDAVKGQFFFLGYLTIIDFSLYQLMRYMEMLFAQQILNALPKLQKIKQSVGCIPQIASYESSKRAIKEMDPLVLKKKAIQKLKK